MKNALVNFVGSAVPRFWAWGGAPYDWLAMAQLFPVEERVPDGWRYTAYDVSLLVELAGTPLESVDTCLLVHSDDGHHALADARWLRDVFRALTI